MLACGTCDRAFSGEGALQQHVRDSPAHAVTFDCETCDRAFSSEEALQQHVRDSPARAVIFDCETCNRTFDSEDDLQQHMREAHGPDSDRTWSMHPYLHDGISRLLAPDSLHFQFHQAGRFEDCTRSYDTNIMGQFSCSDRACTARRWSSKRIAITIRLYRDEKYNVVVWHQHCQDCDSLGQPILDSTYAERVAYRLKKWYGVAVETPYYSGQSKGPHQSDLCEGCKEGHCKEQL